MRAGSGGVPVAATRVQYPAVPIPGAVLVRTRHDEAKGDREDGLISAINELESAPVF